MEQIEKVNNVLFELEQLTEKDKEAVLQSLVESKYRKTLEERIDLSKKKNVGRPSKLQPHITERLLIALRQGASIDMATKFAGISHDLYQIWAKKARDYQDTLRKIEQRRIEFEVEYEARGRKGRKFVLTPYEKNITENANKETMDCVELFVLIDQAVAECGVRDLSLITKAAQNGAWTAAAFRLGKRFPNDYGARADEQAQINVNVGFNYVEINRAVPLARPKDFREAERRSISAAEQGIIDVEASEPS